MNQYLKLLRMGLTGAVFMVSMVDTTFSAGFERISIPASDSRPALQAIIWTPCAQTAVPVQMGPFSVTAVKNCPVQGNALPLVMISHGQGGSPLGHHDTAIALADAGFTVVSLKHIGDAFDDKSDADRMRIFESRPRDVSAAISYMLGKWHARQQIAADAVGVFGFSRGGYTALALAGAAPSRVASAERFCASWMSLMYPLCRELRFTETGLQAQADPRVRAIVVVDPLNLFDAQGLKQIHVPVQLWASERGGDGVTLAHVEAVKAALPPTTPYRVAKGAGHFAFLASCPDAFKEEEPEICADPKGFNRESWHRDMNLEVVAFLKKQLRR